MEKCLVRGCSATGGILHVRVPFEEAFQPLCVTHERKYAQHRGAKLLTEWKQSGCCSEPRCVNGTWCLQPCVVEKCLHKCEYHEEVKPE